MSSEPATVGDAQLRAPRDAFSFDAGAAAGSMGHAWAPNLATRVHARTHAPRSATAALPSELSRKLIQDEIEAALARVRPHLCSAHPLGVRVLTSLPLQMSFEALCDKLSGSNPLPPCPVLASRAILAEPELQFQFI